MFKINATLFCIVKSLPAIEPAYHCLFLAWQNVIASICVSLNNDRGLTGEILLFKTLFLRVISTFLKIGVCHNGREYGNS